MHIVVTYYLYCYFRPSASTTRWYSGWPYILYSNYTATSGRVPVLQGGTVGGRTYYTVPILLLRPSASTTRRYSGRLYILYCTCAVTQAECQY